MRAFGPLAFLVSLGALTALVVGPLACDDDPHLRTTPEQARGGGGACEATPGNLPPPNCDNSLKSCSPTEGCTIDEARCGSKSTCLPLADNKGKDVIDLRFRRLNIAAPAALAGPFIQNTVVNLNIDLPEPTCSENGKGLFTWIMRVDRKANTVVTGGAPPSSDPLGKGFCFAAFTLNQTVVQPVTAKIEFTGSTFKTLDRQSVNIPIFLSEKLESAIVLPISDARIEGVTISEDGNCIGSFNSAALDPSCTEDRELCPKWTTAGSLGGYITLEQADGVKIRDLNNKSLCSFLAAEPGLVCTRDGAGKITYVGDFCSTTKQAGGCADSVWMAATFAASAAKIFDGKGTVEGCSGATSQADAGPDASADADVGDADASDQ